MSTKLDLADRKILNQLDIDSRQSDSKIAKKTHLSKQVVNYRIKNLLKKGIITAFTPQIDIAKLGYGIHKVYIQFGSITKEKEEFVWDYLVNKPNIVWVISCSGKWNIVFGIASKNINQFDFILTEFMDKFSEHILNRSVTVFNKATLHHRKWLVDETIPNYWTLGSKIESFELNQIDRDILNLLSINARRPLIEIANKIQISSSLAMQRIRKLTNKKIIGAFRIAINREKLNMNYCKSFIYYQNKTSKKEDKLIGYCNGSKYILGVSKSIGPWDLELEFEVGNYSQFHKIMKEMKNKFPLIKNFDTAYIEKEYGQSFLPKNV